jgi:MFS family permease
MAGFTGELYRPASSALLADLVPPGLRVTAFAAYRMALNAGWACGPALGGLLAKSSYLWLFVGDAISSLLFAVVAWFAFPKETRAPGVENRLTEIVRVIRHDRRLRQILIASLAVGFVFVQISSSFSLEVTDAGFPAATYGLLASLNGLLVLLCELPMTSFTKHWPARQMMALGYAVLGLGFGLNALPGSLALLVLAMVMLTLGETICMPVAGAYIANLAPEDKRGLYMGTYGLTWSLAFVFGPGLGLTLYAVNPLLVWFSCAAAGLFAAALILRAPEAARSA